MRHRVRTLLCVFLAPVSLVPCLAQIPAATVAGRISDTSKAVIVGAKVDAINTDTNVRTSGTTNKDGIYTIGSLLPGNYRIEVSKQGFKTIVKPDVVLHVQDVIALNFDMSVGSTSESVTVEGGAPLVNTESAAVSTVVDRNFAENLPLNGRSFNTLLQLTPGVVIAASPSFVASSPGQFSVAGQRTDGNSFSVDGVSANFGIVATSNLGSSGTGSTQAFSALGGTSSLVSADDLQEFRVETSSFAPEFGRSPGGQVMLTTRSGTNNFHGSLYEYFRNDVLDANDWFANHAGKHRAPERHNDFGVALGGPIWRNRTFFFLSYEGARLRIPQSQVISVPSAYARSVAPASLAPFLNTFPQPDDRRVQVGTYNSTFASTFSNAATLDATSIRLDHKFNNRFSVFGRYNYAPSRTTSRPSGVNYLQTLPTNTQTLTLSTAMLLRNNVLNMLRGNYSIQKAGTVFAFDSFGGAAPLDPALLLGSTPTSMGLGFLQIGNVANRVGLGSRNRATQLNFVDDLAITVGKHQVKVGADYRAIFVGRTPPQYQTTFTATTVQGFLATRTATFTGATNLPARILAQVFSLYAQDTWKITQRLAVTYGLRWELAPAPSGRGMTRIAAWSNTSNLSATALAPRGTPLWTTVYDDVAPRIGIVYSLTPQGDFVVRAAFGVFYDTTFGQAGSIAGLFPNSAATTSVASLPVNNFSSLTPTISLQPPFPIASGFANDLALPRSYQWNSALQKSFGDKQVISATFVGQAGRRLLRNEGSFKPNANFASFFTVEKNTAWSNYDALQLQYRCKVSTRFQGLANYTWSHSLDNVSDDGLQATSNSVISGARDYANSNFDVRHSFSAGVTYDVPSGVRSRVLKPITSDWSLGTIVFARSGFPFNAVVLGGAPGGISLRRPNIVTGPLWVSNILAAGGKSLNPAAFAIPPIGQQGTESRNDISGFGLTQVDFSIARRFVITERWNLQFRADAFNVLNHPNFANPSGIFSGPTTPAVNLQASQMLNNGLGGLNPLFQEGGPRSLQLSLRLTF